MGTLAISLWDEAAQLERNRTACDGGTDGFPQGARSDWHCGPRSSRTAPLPSSVALLLSWTSLAAVRRSCPADSDDAALRNRRDESSAINTLHSFWSCQGKMEQPCYGVATARRGSFDDSALSLRPVSNRVLPVGSETTKRQLFSVTLQLNCACLRLLRVSGVTFPPDMCTCSIRPSIL